MATKNNQKAMYQDIITIFLQGKVKKNHQYDFVLDGKSNKKQLDGV